MIFFMSVSWIALILAISMVRRPEMVRVTCIIEDAAIILEKRYMRNTPAVTRVDECTRADTGVGAAIAAGSHLE